VLLVKLAVAGALLVYLFGFKVHWGDYTEVVPGPDGETGTADDERVTARGLGTILIQADPVLLAAAMVCFAAPIVVVGLRWRYLLKVIDIRIRTWEAVRLTFLGYFFNHIIPGLVSGDLVKAYYVFRHTERKAAALVSIFMDRALGLLEFALLPALVMASLSAAGRWSDRLRLPAIVVGIVLAVLAAGVAVVVSGRLRGGLRRLFGSARLQRHLDVAGQAVALYRRRLGALPVGLALTFAAQVIHITGLLLAGRSLGLPVAWYHFFLFAPLVYIIAAVPVSPGGLGVMEWCFVTFFAAGDVTVSGALALALVARLGPMLCSLPGVPVALTGPRLPATERIRAELVGRPPQ